MVSKLRLCLAVLLCFSASPALALFENGGFETGDFTGWTLDYGWRDDYNRNIYWGQADHGLKAVIDNTATMPGQTLDINPYNGSRMARINDIDGGNHATKIWQQDTISQQDLDDGGNLYVNWGAVLDDPQHDKVEQPYFGISVWVAGILQDTFEADASDAASNGWIVAGNYYGDPLYYKSDTWVYDISTFNLGDPVKVEMFVADCSLGGHGGYAFLDGIGTTYQPPTGGGVPAPGALLLGCIGTGVSAWLARRRTLA